MHYQFPPDVEKLVREQMAKGSFSSEDDLLREALKTLDARNNVVIEEDTAVVEGIRRGLSDAAAGRSRSFDDFDTDFRAKHDLSDDA
ncbi:MAG: hypothetical protein DWQ37_13130 [Planctomycetota bacterium]|nr:MAG: hypothetical protein DWQ37_13130 [Planctomycetota bacterium]